MSDNDPETREIEPEWKGLLRMSLTLVLVFVVLGLAVGVLLALPALLLSR